MRRLALLLTVLTACATDPSASVPLDAALALARDSATLFQPDAQGDCQAVGVVPDQDLALDLRVDLGRYPETVWAIRETLTFTATEAGSAVRLFGHGHHLVTSTQPYRHSAEDATFCTAPFAAGQRVTVTFEYETSPPNWKGVTWAAAGLRLWKDVTPSGRIAIGPDSEPNGSSLWLYSPQSRHAVDVAHSGIPAISHVDLEVVAPSYAWQVVGPSGLGTHEGTVWHFTQDQPVPIYALSFAASPDWKAVPLPPAQSGLAITALRPVGDDYSWDQLGGAPKTIDQLEARFGPYPFAGNLTLAVLPEYDLAMEDVGNVWHSRWSAKDANTVIHELVHQWFGNGVRVASWAHVWLDEGLTTWVTDFVLMEAMLGPPQSGQHTYAESDRESAASLCSQGQGPLRLPDGVDANSLWPVRQYWYDYAAAVLHMIDLRLQEQTGTGLEPALRDWFALHKAHAITTEDFRDFLAQRTQDPAYWQTFFQEWVLATPCPTLSVRSAPGPALPWRMQIRRDAVSKQTLSHLRIVAVRDDGDHEAEVDLPAEATWVDVPLELPKVPYFVRVDPQGQYVFGLESLSPELKVTFLPR